MKYIEYIKSAITAMHSAAAILNDQGYAGDAVVGPINDVLIDYARLVRDYNIPDLPTLETLLKANAEGRQPCSFCEYYGEASSKYGEFEITSYSKGKVQITCNQCNHNDVWEIRHCPECGRKLCQEAEAALEKEKSDDEICPDK